MAWKNRQRLHLHYFVDAYFVERYSKCIFECHDYYLCNIDAVIPNTVLSAIYFDIKKDEFCYLTARI